MKKTLCVLFVALILALAGFGSRWRASDAPSAVGSEASTTALAANVAATHLISPLRFEENRGQAQEDALYVSRGATYELHLRNNGAWLGFRTARDRFASVGLTLTGAATSPEIVAEEPLPGTVTYLIGRDEANWLHGLATYGRVRYRDVYPGIDLLFYGNQNRLEYDFVVAPGVDPEIIRLKFDGADRLDVAGDGGLILTAGTSQLRQAKPVVYQDVDGTRQEVASRYEVTDGRELRFQIDPYDTTRPLVIDPIVLVWTRYIGSSIADDWAHAAALNSKGELIVVGTSRSPVFWGVRTHPIGGRLEPDAFISRFSTDGTLLGTTTLGGGGDEEAVDVALDANDNIYLTGTTTSTNFPTTPNAAQPISASLELALRQGLPFLDLAESSIGTIPTADADAYLTKLDSTGQYLRYSTYLSGSPELGIKLKPKLSPKKLGELTAWFTFNPGIDRGAAVAVDAAGNAYVVGVTLSNAYPVTEDAFKEELNGVFGAADGFLTKIDTNLSGPESMKFSSYLGGSCHDEATDVALDRFGRVHVTGHSDIFFPICGGFATTPGAVHEQRIKNQDAFVMKLALTGTVSGQPGAIFSTFIGTDGRDRGGHVGVDHAGNVYASFIRSEDQGVGGRLHVVSLTPNGTAERWHRDLGRVVTMFPSEFPLGGDTRYRQALFVGASSVATRLFAIRNDPGPILHEFSGLDTGDSVATSLALGGPTTIASALVADARRVYVVGATNASGVPNPDPEEFPDIGVIDPFAAKLQYSAPPVLSAATMSPRLEGETFTAAVATYTRPSTVPTVLNTIIDWGDGVTSTIDVAAGQSGAIQATHTYRDNGAFKGRTCVTEEGIVEDAQCVDFNVDVANVAPAVAPIGNINANTPGVLLQGVGSDSGAARIRIATLTSFTDPSTLDTHTASIRWNTGDPSAQPQAAEVASVNRSVIEVVHDFGTDAQSPVPIELCVTDDDLATTCVQGSVSVPVANLQVEKFGPTTANMCTAVDYRLKVTNTGPDDAHNVTIRDELSDPANMAFLSTMVIGGSGTPTVTDATQLPTFHGGKVGAVAIEGTTAVVTNSGGQAWVFERNPTTQLWEKTAQLETRGTDAVAIRGDWIVVGNKRVSSTPSGAKFPASVDIFRRVDGVWISSGPADGRTLPVQRLTGGVPDSFATAVAIGDDYIAVGDPQGGGSGAVHMYRRDDTIWTYDRTLTPPPGLELCSSADSGPCPQQFGTSVALTHNGHRLVVGAPLDRGFFDETIGKPRWLDGSVYTYLHFNFGCFLGVCLDFWAAPADFGGRIFPNDHPPSQFTGEDKNQGFGSSVALDESSSRPVLVVGAPHDQGETGDISALLGAAYLFELVNTDWTQFAKLLPNDPARGAQFGRSVDISGNRAIVGRGPGEGEGTNEAQDRAYLFSFATSGQWSQVVRLRPAVVQTGDRFASEGSVGLSGGEVIASAKARDNGQAYMFSSCLQPQGPGTRQCNVGTLAAGQSAEFLVTVALGKPNGAVSATGSAFAGAIDRDVPNRASVTTSLTPGACGTLADVTPPTISPTVIGTQGKNGYHIKDPVTVSWLVSEPEGGLTTSGCQSTTISADTAGTTLTCSATSPGGTASQTVSIKLDTRAPNLAASAIPAIDAATGDPASLVSFACADPANNGVASGIDTCPAPVTVFTGAVVERVLEDRAGNSSRVRVGVPRAVAGADQHIIVMDACSAVVTLTAAGSTNPTGGPLAFTWRLKAESGDTEIATGSPAMVTLPIGMHVIELIAQTAEGTFAIDTMTVTVEDPTPPVFGSIPGPFEVDAVAERTPIDGLVLPSATDACPVTVRSDAPPDGFLAGETTVTFVAHDGANEIVATTRVIVRPRVDIGVSIEPAGPSLAGLNRALTLRIGNTGVSRATKVVVRPVFPLGLTPVRVDPGIEKCTVETDAQGEPVQSCTPIHVFSLDAACVSDEHGFDCTVFELPAGGTTSLTLTLAVPSSFEGEFPLDVSAMAAETEMNGSDNSANTMLSIVRSSDLMLSVVGTPAPAVAGTNVSYVAEVRSLGPSDAAGVVFTASIPSGAADVIPPAGCTVNANVLSCALGHLAAGSAPLQLAFTIKSAPAARGGLELNAALQSADPDPNTNNNEASSNVMLEAHTDVSVAGTIEPSPVMAGSNVTYRLRLANAGPSDATNLAVRVERSEGVAFDSPLPQGCVLSDSADRIHCNRARLEAGSELVLPIGLTVDAFARGVVRLDASAASEEDERDLNADNNAISGEAAIEAVTNLAIVAQQSGEAVAGRSIGYDVTISNNGPSGASGAELHHDLPAGFSFQSSDGCTADNGVASCALGSLEPRTSVQRRITVLIAPSARGAATARFELTSEGLRATSEKDSDLANNTASLGLEIQARTDLAIVLSADADSAVAGGPARFTATVINHGPSDATRITIDAPGDDPHIDLLPVGESRRVPIEMIIDPFARGLAQASASVRGAETDEVPANNDASAEIRITTEVDLLVTMSAPDPALAGGALAYTITLTNHGPSGAMGVHHSQLLAMGTAFESAAGCTFVAGEGSDQVHCAMDRLAPGATETRSVVVAVDPFRREPLESSVVAVADEDDTDPLTNQFTLTTPVRAEADMMVAVNASPNPAMAGGVLTHTIEVTNHGASGATGVRLTHAFTGGATYAGASGADCTFASGEIACEIDDLRPNASASVTIRTLPATAGLLRSTSLVFAVEEDPDSENNSASTEVVANGPATGPAGAGDFDGDGDLDLAVADKHADVVKIYRNDAGQLVETSRIPVARQPIALAIGDLDGNGTLDIAAASESDAVTILANDGHARFAQTASVEVSGHKPSAIATGDLNGDGTLELAVASDHDTVMILGREQEIWAERQTIDLRDEPSGASHPSALALGDLDGDGDLDLAVAARTKDHVAVLLNVNGTLGLAGAFSTGAAKHPVAVAVGDVNGDGALDLLVAGEVHDQAAVLLNDRQGGFGAAHATAVGHKPSALAAGDLTGDGALDLVTVNRNDDSLSLLVNTEGAFPASAVVENAAGRKPIAVIVGDFNDDGALDLVVVSEMGYTPQLMVSR